MQLRSFDAVCRMVECNVGIGIVPETTARRVAQMMAIVPVALSDPWAARALTICVRRLDELPPYARDLVAEPPLRDAYARLDAARTAFAERRRCGVRGGAARVHVVDQGHAGRRFHGRAECAGDVTPAVGE